VTGSGFTDLLGLSKVQSIAFGNTAALCFSVNSSTQVTAVSPPQGTDPPTVDVTVTTTDGTSTTGAADEFAFAVDPTIQVMMTLAGVAATSASERPSGETVEQQQQRILAGINTQLANASLATAGDWQAIWLGLTQDRANMAYIAQNSSIPSGQAQEFAVCLRGTQGFLIDILEDVDVGSMLPFMGGNVSQGAMEAFTEIVMGSTLMQALAQLVSAQATGPTIYVTGHSLGGALATTVSLFLAAQGWKPTPTFQVYTFAAPTAGDAEFASAFNSKFPTATCVWNQYDVVPSAWWNLAGGGAQDPPTQEAVEYFYPGMNLPETQKVWTMGLIGGINDLAKGNAYVQPQPLQQPPLVLNVCFDSAYPVASDINTFGDWLEELGYQHANNTYLALLGAPTLPSLAPSVSSISPTTGPAGGWTPLTITGTGFTADSVVDFGVIPATVLSVATDGSGIMALSPAGAGIVDVRVTNMSGTSAAGAADQFTYTS
jgi:hypothetical protein